MDQSMRYRKLLHGLNAYVEMIAADGDGTHGGQFWDAEIQVGGRTVPRQAEQVLLTARSRNAGVLIELRLDVEQVSALQRRLGLMRLMWIGTE